MVGAEKSWGHRWELKRIKLGQRFYRRLMKRVLERDGWRCQKRHGAPPHE
jgi:hypothetical protein